MESGPLPPHERSWRHPSELGPTKLDVDTGPRSHVATLAAGALAVLAVAAIVVVITPRSGSGPVAISVTTTPMRSSAVIVLPGQPSDTTAIAVRPNRPAAVRASSDVLLTTFASYPHAIISAPQPDLDSGDVAHDEPDDDDVVYLRTEDVTYRMQWQLVPMIDVPDGSVVFDAGGDILARVSHGELLNLVVD